MANTTSPFGGPSHAASSTRPGPSRGPRRTRGILDARIKKLSAGPLAGRVRGELFGRLTRTLDQLLPPLSDTFTFKVAEASKMALFFNTNGSLYHIRKFTLEYDVSSTDRRLDTADQVEPYITAIKNLPSLEDISMAGISIGPWAAFPLATALRTKKRLRRADFSDCFAQRVPHELSPAMGALALALIELPNLGAIDLSSNALGPSVEGPVTLLAGNHTPLQELNLNDTGMGPETGVAVANALVTLASRKAAVGAPPLRELLLIQNKLCQDDETPMYGMPEWAAAFAAHPNLRKVALKNNGIRHGGMDHLVAAGLSHLRDLEELDLADNIITARGKTHRALADAVKGWPALRVLDLDESLLGSRGAGLLIGALAAVQPSRLETLRLTQNNLTPANTLALAGVLWRLPELRELTLDTNNFPADDEGYRTLVRLLKQRAEERGVVATVDDVGDEAYSDPSLSPVSNQQQRASRASQSSLLTQDSSQNSSQKSAP
ncbi:hypothetical protein DHEL01_v206663 [Diaporthe helianthi]|uniref:RNI-like protein n=1 Tax=Diaporthe helianthi TaxID=158607 RepID=A0A2P5HXF8_DIAHE|nr:hypothetical protein DHEL01_v206663 [Diaporthe helianthi]